MRKHRRLLLAVAAVIALAVAIWLVSQRHEPVYEGRPLSEWLRDYDDGEYITVSAQMWKRKDDEAIRKIGTNAIPALLERIQATDSPLKAKLTQLSYRQNFIKFRITPASIRKREGMAGFEALGPEAASSVPELMEMLAKTSNSKNQAMIAGILGDIGPAASPAFPLLLDLVTNKNYSVHSPAIYAIGKIHTQPAIGVPILTRLLGDNDPDLRFGAAEALGEYGSEARSAFASLVPLVSDNNQGVKSAAEVALEAIDADAADRVLTPKQKEEARDMKRINELYGR